MLEVEGHAEQQEGWDPHGYMDMGSVWGTVIVLIFHKKKPQKPNILNPHSYDFPFPISRSWNGK